MRFFSSLIFTFIFAFSSISQAQELPPSQILEGVTSPDGLIFMKQFTRSDVTYNKVTLLHLGKSSRPMRFNLINNARETLHLTVPYWNDEDMGRTMLRAIRDRQQDSARPDIDIRVLEDIFTPLADLENPNIPVKLYGIADDIQKAINGKLEFYNEPQSGKLFSTIVWRNRLHDKMIIADAERVIVGGMNMAKEYLEGGETREGWHDTDLLIEGPGAVDAEKIFQKVWSLNFEIGRPFSSFGRFPIFNKHRIPILEKLFYEDQTYHKYRELLKKKELDFRIDKDHLLGPEIAKLNAKKAAMVPEKDGVPTWLVYENPLLNREIADEDDDGEDEEGKKYPRISKVRNVVKHLVLWTSHRVRAFIPYLTMTPQMSDFIASAAKWSSLGGERKLQIQIVTNSENSHDLGRGAYQGANCTVRKLLAAGVQVFEWQGHGALLALEEKNQCKIPEGPGTDNWPGNTLHSKVMVFDDQVSMIGSHNFNERSEYCNNEIMAVVADPVLTKQVNGVFDYDLDTTPSKIECVRADGTMLLLDRPLRTKEISLQEAEAYYAANKKRVDRQCERGKWL